MYDKEGEQFKERPPPTKGVPTNFQDLASNYLEAAIREEDPNRLSKRDIDRQIDQSNRISKYSNTIPNLYEPNDQQKTYKENYSTQ